MPEMNLISSIAQIENDEVATAGVAMMGIVARLPQYFSSAKLVGEILLHVVTDPATSCEVVAEALNSIFDVFAEEDHNTEVQHLGLCAKLQEFVPKWHRKVHFSVFAFNANR